MKLDRIIITKEEALEIANIKDNQIHNFVMSGFSIIGANWSKKDFIKCLEEADSIEIGGSVCQNMNHALVVTLNNKNYFFETILSKLNYLLEKSDKE